jgi:hypothetical protein
MHEFVTEAIQLLYKRRGEAGMLHWESLVCQVLVLVPGVGRTFSTLLANTPTLGMGDPST